MYKVIKKFRRGSESEIGQFKTIDEARRFIQKKLAEDAAVRLDAVYSILEGFDEVETLDQSHLKETSQPEEDQSSASQKGSGQRFSPSPFNTAPRPKGVPPSSWKDEEDKK